MKREAKFPWWGWLVVLCLLPVVYVMSVFPVGWVLYRLNLGEPDWFTRIYSPLIWAVDEWDWFGSFVESIAKWMGIA